MKILLSGFEPFGNRDVNQSWELAKQYLGHDDYKVIKLPVSFSNAHRVLIEEYENGQYDMIIMLGETTITRDVLRFERVALNLMDSTGSDNDGVTANENFILKNGPTAYFCTFPVKQTVEYLKGKGYKVRISNSAGTFVCNSLYYNILHYLKDTGRNIPALFIHLPVSTETVSLRERKDILSEIYTSPIVSSIIR